MGALLPSLGSRSRARVRPRSLSGRVARRALALAQTVEQDIGELNVAASALLRRADDGVKIAPAPVSSDTVDEAARAVRLRAASLQPRLFALLRAVGAERRRRADIEAAHPAERAAHVGAERAAAQRERAQSAMSGVSSASGGGGGGGGAAWAASGDSAPAVDLLARRRRAHHRPHARQDAHGRREPARVDRGDGRGRRVQGERDDAHACDALEAPRNSAARGRVPTGDRRGSLLPGLGEAAVAAASDRVVGAGAAGATDPDATFEDQGEARANDWRATMIEKVSSARAVGVRV